MISIEHDRDSIVVGELCIANQFTGVDMGGISVKSAYAKVDVLVIEQHANFRALRRRRTFGRLLL